jgi:acetoin utilization protein AcuB
VRVRMWMTRDIAEVRPSTPVSAAARLMVGRGIRHLLVTDGVAGESARLVGILSRYDVARAFPPDVNPFSADPPPLVRPVGEIMSRPVETVAADVAIEDAAGLMLRGGHRALPVLDGSRLVGILTETDVVRAFLGLLGADRGGVRVAFSRAADEDVLALVGGWAHELRARVVSFAAFVDERKPMAAVRLHGPDAEAFIDRVRRSGHAVLEVSREAAGD